MVSLVTLLKLILLKFMSYLYLAIAIVAEVIATSALKASKEFQEWLPSLIAVIGYCASFYFMTLAMRQLSIGVVYASWSGLGIVLVASVGYFYYNEPLNMATIIGMLLIIAGVLIMNLCSNGTTG